MRILIPIFLLLTILGCSPKDKGRTAEPAPNVVLIYTDDLGYGDISAYGASKIKTPNIDRLASEGLMFTRAYATSATCTPSRYALLTGEYPWRRPGTGIAKGDAALIIPPDTYTLADLFKDAGYQTGIVGKWHLGLGPEGGPDWNKEIRPGPADLGFDYSFLIPATGDRVPTVFVENNYVVGLDPNDPIKVSFDEPLGDEPTGKDNPELLKMHPSHGHDNTIVNGISRIGFMTGGKSARWVDEEIADVITGKAKEFIGKNKENPFFLFFSTHDIHVPRAPHARFAGKSGMGPRGDVLLQLDWSVGEILAELEKQGIANNTMVIFTSDNGPVVDDGYKDQAVELLGDHKPWGPLRGGKYSIFEAGTRIPFIVYWPGKIEPGVSDALFSQIDLLASFAGFFNKEIPAGAGKDGHIMINTLIGKSSEDREFVVEHGISGVLAIVKGEWKYIEPHKGPRINRNTNTELGHLNEPQLYNVKNDAGETENLAKAHPEIVSELANLLQSVKNAN